MDDDFFEWDASREADNLGKHGVGFEEAIAAFDDPRAIYLPDDAHSGVELRYFCIGRTLRGIVTVRFTRRGGSIRVIGAGYWRKGLRLYEENHLHG